jgi:hypothetical protein
VPPYSCLQCTPYDSMLLLARLEETRLVPDTESQYARFQDCTAAADAARIPCSRHDSDTVQGHAPGFGLDCPRACATGTHPQIEQVVLDIVAGYSPEFRVELRRLQTPVTTNLSWQLHSCVVCDPVLGVRGTPLPAAAHWFVPGCDFRCNQSMGYYRRGVNMSTAAQQAEHSNDTRVCTYCGTPRSSICSVGEYPVGNCTHCAACAGELRGAWNFTSAGVVDEPASCTQQCAAGWFRDWFSEECRPHTVPTCRADQYLLAGTPTSDAFCAQCRSCAGMRRTRGCNSTTDGVCKACGASGPGLLLLHENCTTACAPGYIWNVRTERCEACDVPCAPGSRPPPDRHNCTHCAACPAAPPNATFTRGCTWSCRPDQTVHGAGHERRCVDLQSLQEREPATPSPTASTCADHQKLETVSFKTALCVDCVFVTPTDESTWTWTKLAGTCSWACNAGLYKYFRSGGVGTLGVDAAGHRHVDCVAWPVYAALSRDPSQPITLAETQQYFAGRAGELPAGARALRAGLGSLPWTLILTAVVMTQ